MKNPTLATIKKFIKESGDDLLIHVKSKFDGTEDGVRSTAETHFTKATREAHDEALYGKDHRLGVYGAWFVFGSRDYITVYDTPTHTGFEVYNSCGTFVLAKLK